MKPRFSWLACSKWMARVACGALCISVAACGSLRRAEPAPVMQSPPAAVTESPPAPMPAEEPPSESGGTAAAIENSAPPPACSCGETKSKPKPKPKPKPEHKEAPPQLPTAPAVVGTPLGGVVDAQVHSMNVSVMSILGKRVIGPKGEDLGRVVDVLADASGRVRVAIIDFGGFLGVGNHRIAVDWPLLRFDPEARDAALVLSLSREKLQAAPEYKDIPRPETLMEPPAPVTSPQNSPPEEGKK